MELQSPQDLPKEGEFNYFQNSLLYQQGQFLQWQFDLTQDLIELEHSLRGDHYNDVSAKWDALPELRVMNDKGINRLISLYRNHVGKVFMLSNFKDDLIRQICRDFTHAVESLLVCNIPEFDIEPKNLTSIKTMVESAMIANLRSGIEGFRMRQLVSSYRSNEIINKPNPQQERKLPFLPF